MRASAPVRRPTAATRVTRAVAASAPRRIDWVLLAAVLALSVFGVLLVWSATMSGTDDPAGYMRRQMMHVAIGAVVCFVVASLDFRLSRAYAPIVYLVAVVGLVLVLTPLGTVVNGSRSWVDLGVFHAQPGEAAKVGMVLGIAMLLSEPRDGEYAPTNRDVLCSLVALAVPLGLIVAQPDLGTAVILGAVYLGMLTMSGTSLNWVIGLVSVGVASATAILMLGLLEEYQVARFTTFLNPGTDPRGVGYNAHQALIAVGSGGWNGTGLFDGAQTSGGFVPEQHTDFVFTVAGEELGFIGSAAIILLIGVVLWRILRIAATCAQPYGRLVCVGAATWFAFQSFINIGMTLGLMPITGLPLPFVSYGGTATICGFAIIGLVLSVHARDRGFE